MSDQAFTLEFIGRQVMAVQAEQRRMRSDFENLLHLVVSQNDWNRRFEARLSQFETRLAQFGARLIDQTGILVSGFKGRIGLSQSMIERRIDDLTERVEELETGKPRFSP